MTSGICPVVNYGGRCVYLARFLLFRLNGRGWLVSLPGEVVYLPYVVGSLNCRSLLRSLRPIKAIRPGTEFQVSSLKSSLWNETEKLRIEPACGNSFSLYPVVRVHAAP
jgi:hypothetical protein